MVVTEGTNRRAPHRGVQEQTIEDYTSIIREIQPGREPQPTTPMNPSGLAPWANPYAALSAVTPENAEAPDNTVISPETDPDLDIFWPYSRLPDFGYPPILDTKDSLNTGNPESSVGELPVDLEYHSHLVTDTSSESQRDTLQTQRDASPEHPSINGPTHPPALDTVVQDVVDTQAPGSPTGSSSSVEFLGIEYSGICSSSQTQKHTPQTSGNISSPYSSLALGSPIRGIEVRPPRHTYQQQQNVSSQHLPEFTCGPMRDGDASHDLIKTQREGSSTTSRVAPNIRYYLPVGSSSQAQPHALQNVSRDAVNGSALVSGLSPTNFRDSSYLGLGPYSQPRSDVSPVQRDKGKQPQHHPILVAPSKRTAPLASDNARAARPYKKPIPRSLVRTGDIPNVASSSRGPRRSNCEKLDLRDYGLAMVQEGVGDPRPTLLYKPSPSSSTYNPLVPQVPQYLDTYPVTPSMRSLPPANNTVRAAAQPYSNPASRSLAGTGGISNVALSSSGPRRSNPGEVDWSAFHLPTVEGEVEHWANSQPPKPSPDSPTSIPRVNVPPQMPQTQSYHPVAPSKRTLPPANNTVRAAQPYPNPASRSLARTGGTRNVASSSTGPRRSNPEEVDLSASGLSRVQEAVRDPTTSLLHEPSPSSSTYIPHVSQVPRHLDTQTYHPVAPSKRTPPPANNTVRAAAQPYSKPASRSLVRTRRTRNVASSSTGPRRSNLEEVGSSGFPTVEEETGCASATSLPSHESSSNSPTYPFQAGQGRMTVPLRPWRSARARKRPARDEMKIIEFWTTDTTTGEKTRGTYLADRFEDGPDPNRTLSNHDQLAFPGKIEKGINIKILWPGYENFAKKISIHTAVADVSIRTVRDWVYSALSEFILTGRQSEGTPETDTWHVHEEDPSAIHIDDLILVRLKQVSTGSWAPEVDVLKTE